MNYNDRLMELKKRQCDVVRKEFLDRQLSLNYIQLEAGSRGYALWLQEQGVKARDRIAVVMSNIPEYLLIYAAALRIGAVLVPISVYEDRAEAERVCRRCGVAVLFYDSEESRLNHTWRQRAAFSEDAVCIAIQTFRYRQGMYVPAAAETEEIRGYIWKKTDTMVIFSSSGSTGQRKLIKKSAKSIMVRDPAMRFCFYILRKYFKVPHELIIFNMHPWYHISGNYFAMMMLKGGDYIEYTVAHFKPNQIYRYLQEKDIQLWSGTATMLYRCCIMSNGKMKIPPVVAASGEVLTKGVINYLAKQPGAKLLFSGYGTKEAGGIASLTYFLTKEIFLMEKILVILAKLVLEYDLLKWTEDLDEDYSVGKINRRTRVEIRDEKGCALPENEVGEIFACTRGQMSGYVDGESLDRNEFLSTGDLGWVKDGVLYLYDRKKNLIIRSGSNIIPREVEQVLMQEATIEDVIVCGVKSENYGEEVCACLLGDEAAIDLESTRQIAERDLPRYMRPSYYVVFSGFPYNGSGKIDRRQLKQMAYERLGISV